GFHRLAHRFADLVRLAGRDADMPASVAHGDQRVEAEAPAALHHLGDAVDGDHVLDEPVALTLAFPRISSLAPPPPTAPPPAPTASSASSPATPTAPPATAATTRPTRPPPGLP